MDVELMERCERLQAENEALRHLLGQCYAKLMKFGVENSDPFLMDELKLELMQ